MSQAAQTVRQKFWIKDLETGEIQRCHAIMQKHTEGKTVTWASSTPIGRSSAIQGYSGSGGRTCTYTLAFHTSVEQEDPTTPQDVHDACQFCMSFAYPDYSGGIKPPHRVLIHFGNTTFTAIVNSVSISYEDPFDVGSGYAYNAKVTMSFLEVQDIPDGYADIRRGGEASSLPTADGGGGPSGGGDAGDGGGFGAGLGPR